MKTASMDIGSGTVRVLLGHRENGGCRRETVHRVITRLAEGFADELLSAASMARTVDAARRLAREARTFGAVEIRVSCTGVARRALNARDFLTALRDDAGLSPVLIEGELEAGLSSLGAALELAFTETPFLLLDIGGFSTEIGKIVDGCAHQATSIDVGSLALAQDFFHDDPPTRPQLLACERRVKDALVAKASADLLIGHGVLVGTAGSITNLAAMSLKMERYERGRLNRVRLSREKVQELLDLMVSMPAAARLALPGLEKGREDTIPAGAIICREVMDFLKADSLIVTEGGVLEGVAAWPEWPPERGALLTV